jgi:hypothetical protein
VKLVALDPISSATLKPGMIVRFRVWREVVVNGSTVIPAGTEVGAFVRSVSRGSKEHHRDGSVRLRLQPVDSGGYHINLTMNDDFAPENIKHRRRSKIADVVETAAAGVGVVALAPIVIPMGIAMSTSSGRPAGNDLELKPCFHAEVYVRSARMLSGVQSQLSTAAGTAGDRGVCAGSTESLEFDGAFLDAMDGEHQLRID